MKKKMRTPEEKEQIGLAYQAAKLAQLANINNGNITAGKLEDALKVTNKDIADYLDGLPPEKMHCSVMGREALDAAAANYRGEEYVKDHSESPLICKCFGIEEDKIVKAIKEKQKLLLYNQAFYQRIESSLSNETKRKWISNDLYPFYCCHRCSVCRSFSLCQWRAKH